MAETTGRRHCRRRSPSGRECRGPTRSRCRRSRTCGRSPTSGRQSVTSTVIATRGERLALIVSVRRTATSGRRVRHRGARRRRDRRRRSDRGARRVRPRRHRRRLRGARRPVPRRRSGRPRAHVVGHHAAYAAFNRHELPATTPDWVNIDHRRRDRFAPGDLDRIHPRHVGRHAGHQHLHRGRASAERPRSGRHPCGAWDLARGLRRRVADDRRLRRSKAT